MVVNINAQARLYVPFFILLSSSIIVILFIHWQLSHALSEFADTVVTQDLINSQRLNGLSLNLSKTAMGGILFMGAMSLGFWVLCSHRIFGPMIPILRKLDDLKKGNYENPIHLRPYDELKPLAESINELADILKETKNNHSKNSA